MVGACAPRYATRRRPERFTFGHRLAALAEVLGVPFMPWQSYVADVGCEIEAETGFPAYNEIIVTVPRQSGKTTLNLSWQLDRCLHWGSPQRSAFTAQTGKDARDKWIDELFPQLEASELAGKIAAINRGMGNEAVRFRNGSLIRILSTSASSGHSKTLDQAVMDEVWHDYDDRREQGLRPAMITREDRQLLICSTAGTAASTVYNAKVAAGRRAVEADVGHGIAYFEWSAPEEWDPENRESWWSFMPALGFTITERSIESERLAMKPGEFRRAYGNRPTMGVEMILPLETWQRACDPTAKPEGALRFGLDVAEDRASAAIVAAGANGVLELIDHRPGIGWVVDRANELIDRHGTAIALDFGGPAGVVADSLRRCERMTGRTVLQACAATYDAIIEGTVKFRTDQAFDAAIHGAVRKVVGDMWAWSRKGSVADITPIMAASLALRSTVTTLAPGYYDLDDTETG
jgi:hypothetical protein